MNIKVTRAKLESLVEDMVKATLEPLKQALKDADLSTYPGRPCILTPF